MRPHQWYKNFVIFVGILFSLNLSNPNAWINTLSAFLIFCVLSGSVYITNDIIDREKDRMHPVKRNRPIASGQLKFSHAIIFAIIFIIASITGAFILNSAFGFISVSYFLLILFYSIYLKNIIIVDLLTISIGFVIRAIAGCLAIKVIVSPWLILCAFLLALFLALGKRRHELILLGDDASMHRKILEGYSINMLEQMTNITTSALIASYSIYTFYTNSYYMMLTIPFAIYGLFRYLHLVHIKNFGGEPEMIFKDKPTLINLMLWGLLVVLILYIPIGAIQ